MLRQLMISKKLGAAREALAALAEEEQKLQTRAEELEAAIEEAKTDEELQAVEESIAELEGEKAKLAEKKSQLESEIAELESQLEELKSKDPQRSNAGGRVSQERVRNVGGDVDMEIRRGFFKGFRRGEVEALLVRAEVKEFLDAVRSKIGEARAVTGAELTIPDVLLELLRDNLYRYSKLITKVRVRTLSGKARQNILGVVPEAVWTEMVAKLNELSFGFNQVEVDGYKVGGFVPLPNSILEDSDIALASEVLDMLGQAIGLALDKAILYGKGVKMPLGIATRLAQTEEPPNWGQHAPEWTNLTATHLISIDPDGKTPEEFFAELVLALGTARPNYATGGTFWAMNRATRMKLLSKAITFNSAGAIVAGMNGTMPVEGGEIIELPFVPDGDIIGGYGDLYLLAERKGAQLAVSEHARFIEDQTLFRGTARYDGMPVFGEAFVIVNIDGAAPTTQIPFAADTANP